MSALATAMGGGPSGDDVRSNQQQLIAPSAANYQAGNQAVTAMQGPVAGAADQVGATNLIHQTALGNGPSLARATMQTGLTNTNNAIHAQGMSNMGNTGSGISQRNILNAQAAANNNYVNQAGMASVAEQMGAQANYANAANAQAQTSLGARGQQLGAYQLQGQQGQAYDQGMQNMGIQRANIGLQGTNADAKQIGAIGQTTGNIVGGLAMLSDEACKMAKEQGPSADSKVSKFLSGYNSAQQAAAPPASAAAPAGPAMLAPGQGIMQGGGGAMDSAPSGLAASSPESMQSVAGGVQGLQHFMAPSASPHMASMPGVSMGAMPGVQGMGYMQPQVRSDERCKQMAAQQPSDQQLHGFMQSMDPSTFQYKDQSYSPGTHLGVMAQDVDNSQVGDNIVEDQGGIKQINVPKALGASLASLAYLNERIDKLEGKKKNGRSANA